MAPATVARMATTALTVFPFLKEAAPLNEAGEVADEDALEVPEEPLSEVAVLAPEVAPDEAPVLIENHSANHEEHTKRLLTWNHLPHLM